MNILVIGASGAIGLAMAKRLCKYFPQAIIHATYRTEKPEATEPNLHWYSLDVTQEASIHELSRSMEKLDWLVNCVGMLHTKDQQPEKNLQSIDPHFFHQNISINTLPSLLLAKHFQTQLKASSAARFATISAKVGSITDNQLGGWYSYRASKSALNMAIKNISIEWSRIMPNCAVVALHPGTTDTPLSKPFQKNVPDGKLFSPERVAKDLINMLDTLKPCDNGSFIAYNGERLPW
ncbi:SDR family oxidoreductase [Vibrio atypicus]|uniref:SDR family oxidoreductase n=1 Tax=Vibrio atypicus TaxID=558271 RepID=UPI00135A51FC|nr:SDR family oxidoreductase [Vibrio atypicus]